MSLTGHTIYTHVYANLVYKPTPLFAGHFQVFKVFHNLTNQTVLSMFSNVMSDKQ